MKPHIPQFHQELKGETIAAGAMSYIPANETKQKPQLLRQEDLGTTYTCGGQHWQR
jgi:hypothetical protein